jgi:SAM-dependent methyltransferase
MRLVTLRESGLGITAEEITGLFEPFVDRAATDCRGAWANEVARRKQHLLKHMAMRFLLPRRREPGRRESLVHDEYEKAWRSIDYGAYALDAPRRDHTPWEWRERRMFASDVGATRFRQLLLCRVIERLRPRQVLEVGCGNGINLILLAGRFPAIRFVGIELTAAGHRAACSLQQAGALPAGLFEYAPLPLADLTAFRRIDFRQGNAASLPFADGEFDLVITVVALEQMERVRQQALGEIARVARRHTLMVEPFRDVNGRFWPRLNVRRRDYFRGSIAELRSYGLEPVLALNDFPQESLLRICAVLSEKRHDQTGAPARHRLLNP